MPELLLELLTEEIPARMQARAAEDLCRLVGAALAPIAQGAPRGFHGPRRIGLVMEVAARAETAPKEERGPRVNAPEAALTGFLRKHGAAKEDLTQQGDFWVLVKPGSSAEAAALVAAALPGVLWSFPWPKSMRWGISGFTWVRPLQRILCLLDGEVVPFALAREDDAAHGIASGNETEGHRVHGPGAIRVSGYADYVKKLRGRFVVAEPEERLAAIRDGIMALAAVEGLEVVPDEGLLNEVAGLVEWPVPLLGRIDDDFMDLPAEVMRTSMRVNQRYFALRRPDGSAAPRFALVANIAAEDGGAALVAGNERVLRARLSDARFFWDHDLKAPLESLLPKLDGAVFHAKLGTQGARVRRLERLAAHIAPLVGADPALAARAAKLAKADLASGMVGEFPELQGIMGGYYAAKGGEAPEVAEAISQHYRPAGPGDAVPAGPVAIAVALADKLDQLAGFFAADERPTGSGDPFALRRAALGVIRIIRENGLRLPLADVIGEAFFGFPQSTGTTANPEFGMAVAQERMKAGTVPPSRHPPMVAAFAAGVTDFILERLRVQLRAEGGRHDLVAASIGTDDDILRILARAAALQSLVETDSGAALLAAARRAQNILRIENKKDGPHNGPVDPALLTDAAEKSLFAALEEVEPAAQAALANEDFTGAVQILSGLRMPLDAFFEGVMVNDPDPALRSNRLRLLSRLATSMEAVAELSKIEA
ncbi:glycine--tRNA ligase subunit beta [Rhodovarius lipocyclicus]|uniref:glycine--tRNA ligase subunit beta n=1 Tax=Rhodovarius lipocyclicus TaxID=268410 RepID=UPI00135BA246|nr:glycine--tRNA ligase subunit beta [Rhodovarius lipocyclicus]